MDTIDAPPDYAADFPLHSRDRLYRLHFNEITHALRTGDCQEARRLIHRCAQDGHIEDPERTLNALHL